MPDPPPPATTQWTEYLFLEHNHAGEIYEWWLHAPTNSWFIARRNTVTDEILETMTVDAYFAAPESGAQHERAERARTLDGRGLRAC